MKLTDSVIQKVSLLKSAKSIIQVTKGFSYEEKWQIVSHDGCELFLKIYDYEKVDHAKAVYSLLQHFDQVGGIVPKPIEFIELVEENLCIQIVSNVKGVDGEEILKTVSNDTQYLLGYQAGQELKKLHKLENPSQKLSWEEMRLSKYNRYIEAFHSSSIHFPELRTITRFVDENKDLLKNRPIGLLHDDFHPSNLLFHDGRLTAVIDFDRFEWGDPYHEFHKIALFTSDISKDFAIGQIDGYFEHQPPEEFWHYYTLYAAMIIPSDIIWSYKTTPNIVHKMWKRVYRIMKDHQDFQSMIPSWYEKKSKL